MAIHWDEGYTLGREEALRDWFRALRDPPRFAADWQPRPPADELVQRPTRTPPPRPDQTRHSPQAPVRPRRPGLVLAVRARGAARPSPVLRLARLDRRLSGPVVARAAASAAGADPAVQPDGRGHLFVPGDAMGLLGGEPSPRVAGFFSRTCSATVITRPTTPSCRRSGCWPSSRSSRPSISEAGATARRSPLAVHRDLRPDPGLRRRHQADRLVPPPAVSGLGRLVPQPSGLHHARLSG